MSARDIGDVIAITLGALAFAGVLAILAWCLYVGIRDTRREARDGRPPDMTAERKLE